MKCLPPEHPLQSVAGHPLDAGVQLEGKPSERPFERLQRVGGGRQQQRRAGGAPARGRTQPGPCRSGAARAISGAGREDQAVRGTGATAGEDQVMFSNDFPRFRLPPPPGWRRRSADSRRRWSAPTRSWPPCNVSWRKAVHSRGRSGKRRWVLSLGKLCSCSPTSDRPQGALRGGQALAAGPAAAEGGAAGRAEAQAGRADLPADGRAPGTGQSDFDGCRLARV